jgi:N-acetylglucosaminyldiphosphoundecaprenol N-acetyl-beta-D-mannosaminyltransferase
MTSSRTGRRQYLMGMPLDALTRAEAMERVRDGLASRQGGGVLTPNLDILRQYQRSPLLHQVFERTELLVPDGTPLVWASRLKGTPVPERVTGTDMLWGVAEVVAEAGGLVFLAGGHPGVARRAADRLEEVHPGLRVAAHPCYIRPGPIGAQVDGLACALAEAAPDVVYLGLPFAGQVHVMTTQRARLPSTWFVGVGSSFDFVNGDRDRAPEWLQRLGLEWAHRIVHEPRVWRRYLVHGLPFAARLGLHVLSARVRGGLSRG